MSYRDWLLTGVFVLSFALMLTFTSATAQESYEELLTEEDFPEDLDSLEEFIQSYYLLLESDQYLQSYKFIHPSKNKLQNDNKKMKLFYHKLLELRNGQRRNVVIYQIGDSHIQSGYFSGTARSALQKYYGNAGRGLVFPLRMSGTNQPDDYSFTSSSRFTRIDDPRSLSGFTLANSGDSSLKIKTNKFFNLDCRFDAYELLAELKSEKDIETNGGALSSWVYSLGTLTNETEIVLNDNISKLYGVNLLRNEPGLIYHSMGINGAGFYTLANQSLMFVQIGELKPDLIVVSLGTNDAQGRYRNDITDKNFRDFMRKLRESNNDVPILFTLPPDSYKGGKPNADLSKVEKVIIGFAKEEGFAWWDLSEVMGGKGSVIKWKANKMATKDNLHYTPKGYMLQGHLFYQAVIKGYKRFSETQG